MNINHELFAEEMVASGRTVKQYHGRNFYEGPSVTCWRVDLQEIIRSTSVGLQWDDMGKRRYVVYPRQ